MAVLFTVVALGILAGLTTLLTYLLSEPMYDFDSFAKMVFFSQKM